MKGTRLFASVFSASVSCFAFSGSHSVDVGYRSRRLLRDLLWSDPLPTRFTMIVLTGTVNRFSSGYCNVVDTAPTGSKGTVSSLFPLRSLTTVPLGTGSDLINYLLSFHVRYGPRVKNRSVPLATVNMQLPSWYRTTGILMVRNEGCVKLNVLVVHIVH